MGSKVRLEMRKKDARQITQGGRRAAFHTVSGRCGALLADDRSKIRKSLQGFHAAWSCTKTSASEGGYLIGYRLVACIDGAREIHGLDLDRCILG